MENRRILVLHSGGLDSTVCLLMAHEKGCEVVSLGIDYNQRHRNELEFAKEICLKHNIPRKILRVKWDKPIRKLPLSRKKSEIGKDISPAFLPGRNAVFLSLAFAEAVGLGMTEVWIGVNTIDYSGYPDCREDFVRAFQKMIKKAIPDGPKLVTPLLNMTKPQIALEAKRLGLRKYDTWSCYRPVKTINGFRRCGKCDACVLHKYAWENMSKVNDAKAA